jgi:outer membrane lipoprotein SlyB
MNFQPRFALFASAALALTLSLAGCKSNTTPQNQADSSQPTAGQPASPDTASPSAGQPAADQAGAPSSQQAAGPRTPPPPVVVSLPEGTSIRVRLDSDLGSKISQPGDTFTATVADDVTKGGDVIIAKGARAEGTVVDAKPLGRFKGGAALVIKLDRVSSRWGSYPVETSSISQAQNGKGKRSATMVGGGAGLGALIGGLAGGGKGAAIGALAGGGAGTAGSAFTGNKQIVLPAETLLTFKLDHSVRITEKHRQDDPELQQR